MKSLCIKINNNSIIRYLLNVFSLLELDDLYLSSNSFKIYDNVIIHYTGNNIDLFYKFVSSALTDTILKFYEPITIKKELNNNFFYFSSLEKERIIELYNLQNSIEIEYFKEKYLLIYNAFHEYIKYNHSIVLNGFYNFRLQEYHKFLDSILSTCINKYLIEREYFEFINILKLYINSNIPKTSLINLIYFADKIILLDENNNIINCKTEQPLGAKFLSDITFSENDYILNYLLNVLPSHITIHFPNEKIDDEFINTLKLIFENRISICNNCNICSLHILHPDIKT